MAIAETANLIVTLSLKGNFASQIKTANRELKGFNAKLSDTESRAYRAGQQIGTGIKNTAKIAAVGIGLLASQVALGLSSLTKLEDAMVQTEAVIKSTGSAAGVTAKDVRTLAEEYESLNATIGDEVIQSGENLLLTFTNIKKDAFEPALQAALDMNEALGKGPEGLTDTIRILGKALNDPAKGLTALQRIGIRFTDTQKKQIEAALKAGDTFKAQSIILAELEKRFGGSFLAGGSTTTGKVAKFTDSIEDLQRALATALLPTIGKIADKLSSFLKDPAVVAGVEELGKNIAGLFSDENLTTGADALKGLFELAKKAAPAIKSAAEVTGKVVSAAVNLFKSLPPELQTLLVSGLAINKLTGGLVTNIAGGLISSVLKQLVSGVVNVNGGVVNVNGAGGLPTGAAGGGGLLGTIGKAILPVAIVAVTTEAALAFSGLQDPQHQFTPKNRFGDNVFRGTNDKQKQIAQILKNIEILEQRANAGDENARRQLAGQREALERLRGKVGSAANRQAAETRRLRSTVANKDTKVTVKTTVVPKTYINGRLLASELVRYTQNYRER